MKKYIVTLSVDVDVKAESEEQAIQKAKNELCECDVNGVTDVYEEC